MALTVAKGASAPYYVVSLKEFGAAGDGVTDDTDAITSWLAALSKGTIYAETRNLKGYVPAGVYLFNTNFTIGSAGVYAGIDIFGDGDKNSIFLAGAESGNAITIAGEQVTLTDLGVYATTARTASAGDAGIYINASASTTSARVTLRNVHVLNQPGHGVHAVRVEHHLFERVWASYCGGKGIYLDHGAGAASWNLFLNCRAQYCGGVGIELTSNTQHNTLINCEALNNEGTESIYIKGRGNILINPDAENSANITGATSYVGIKLEGTRHQVLGGYIGDMNAPIKLIAASLCVIDQPTISNGASAVTATYGVEADASSTRNRYYLPGSATSITNILEPATGNQGDLVIKDGLEYHRPQALRLLSASPGATYAPDMLYTEVFALTISQNLTISSPTNYRTGQVITFHLIQNGTGGYTVSWNGIFKVTWSNTGNTANKTSSISFFYDGTSFRQLYAQSPYA